MIQFKRPYNPNVLSNLIVFLKGFAKTTFGQKDKLIISTKDQMLFF